MAVTIKSHELLTSTKHEGQPMKNALIRSNTARLTTAAVLACTLLATSCAPSLIEAPEELPPFSDSLVQCTRWMDGSFTHDRASRGPQAPTMQMNQARIWTEKTDGIWLYSELLLLSGNAEMSLGEPRSATIRNAHLAHVCRLWSFGIRGLVLWGSSIRPSAFTLALFRRITQTHYTHTRITCTHIRAYTHTRCHTRVRIYAYTHYTHTRVRAFCIRSLRF